MGGGTVAEISGVGVWSVHEHRNMETPASSLTSCLQAWNGA